MNWLRSLLRLFRSRWDSLPWPAAKSNDDDYWRNNNGL